MQRNVLCAVLALAAVAVTACAVSGGSSAVEPTGGAPAEVELTPTVRRVMTATDPSTFVRAAGYPQFVEFFAFW